MEITLLNQVTHRLIGDKSLYRSYVTRDEDVADALSDKPRDRASPENRAVPHVEEAALKSAFNYPTL